jgi:hypothetical protein
MRIKIIALCLFLLSPLATILAYKPAPAAPVPAVAVAVAVEDHGIKDGDDALFNNY